MAVLPKTIENIASETGDHSVAGATLATYIMPIAKNEAIMPPTTTSLAFFLP